MEIPNEIELSLVKNFRMSIWSRFQKSVRDYDLICAGDKVAVCISGSLGSLLMAVCMKRFHRYSKIPFEVEYIFIDSGISQDTLGEINAITTKLELSIKICKEHCANTEALYNAAHELCCNKIALGSSFDDVVETILMGMLYGAEIHTMLPKMRSESIKGMQLIRPMYTIHDEDISKWFAHNELVPKTQIGSKEISPERCEVKELLVQLRTMSSAIDMNIFRSVENVNLQTLIGYQLDGEYHHFLDSYDEGRSVRGTIKNDV